MRAWACGLVRIAACSMPGRRMSSAYRARPLALSAASRRGGLVPIALPSARGGLAPIALPSLRGGRVPFAPASGCGALVRIELPLFVDSDIGTARKPHRRVDDLDVAGAAAEIAGERAAHFV